MTTIIKDIKQDTTKPEFIDVGNEDGPQKTAIYGRSHQTYHENLTYTRYIREDLVVYKDKVND